MGRPCHGHDLCTGAALCFENLFGKAPGRSFSNLTRPLSNTTSDVFPLPLDPDDNESRYLECQLAIEARLQALVGSGWGEQEVLSAVIEVADNLMLANMSNSEFEKLLRPANRRQD